MIWCGKVSRSKVLLLEVEIVYNAFHSRYIIQMFNN